MQEEVEALQKRLSESGLQERLDSQRAEHDKLLQAEMTNHAAAMEAAKVTVRLGPRWCLVAKFHQKGAYLNGSCMQNCLQVNTFTSISEAVACQHGALLAQVRAAVLRWSMSATSMQDVCFGDKGDHVG